MSATQANDPAQQAAMDSESVRNLLRQVIDPEVGLDIVELGLVYRIEPADDQWLIEMTMTSPACPMGEMILDDVHAVLAADNCQADVVLVWEPPWDPSMMSEAGKLELGWAEE